jgi:hypothetical protein
MSGDHNMNQTSAAWRKRQIALDKKAENARELGLDYEPDKTVINMARNAGFERLGHTDNDWVCYPDDIEAFAALVRNDERARCISHVYGQAGSDNVAERTVKAIRSGK